MGSLNLLVVSPTLESGVLDRLLDWSAVGLVGRFDWLALESTRGDEPAARNPYVASIQAGRVATARLAEVINRPGHDLVRVLWLADARDGAEPNVTSADANRIREVVQPPVGVAASFVQAAVLDEPTESAPRIGQQGWHTVAISPEDAASPLDTAPVWWGDDTDRPAVVAAAVASLLGLWQGVGSAPFDLESASAGFVAARAFLRDADASGPERELRAELTRIAETVPLPSGPNGTVGAVAMQDPLAGVNTMSDAWWAAHKSSFLGPRATIAAKPPVKIGLVETLRRFFSFLAVVIKQAPENWLRRTVGAIKAHVASSVQGAVFGDNSRYQVVFGGITGEGMPASWGDRAQAAGSMARTIERGMSDPQRGPADLSRAWSDLIAGGLTLTDGGSRAQSLPSVMQDSHAAIVRDRDLIAPSSARDFVFEPAVAATIQIPRVRAFDLVTADDAMRRLAALEERGLADSATSTARAQLAAWQTQASMTYVGRVSIWLLRAFEKIARDIEQYHEQLARLAADDVDAQIVEKQRKLRRLLRLIGSIALLAIGATVVLGAIHVIGWAAVAGIGAGLLVAGLVSAVVVFYRRQRELFQALHRREQMLPEQDNLRANLRLALEDLERLVQARYQFEAWAEVLGVFLANPLGGQEERSDFGTWPVAFPRGVIRAHAQAPTGAVPDVAATLSRELFQVGWLSGPWSLFLQEAPARIDPLLRAHLPSPEALFAQVPREGEALTAWLESLRVDGVSPAGGRELWRQALAEVADPARPYRSALGLQVARSAGMEESVDDFLGSVGSEGQGRQASLTSTIFSYDARSRDLNRVERAWTKRSVHGLGSVALTVQFSHGLGVGDVLGRPETSGRKPAAPTVLVETDEETDNLNY